ncbi:molybdopterin-binding protein [Glaciimonas sp. CA11.2]|uniref:competence/damage-inducible protein A n=1 Tax=unclassified Glaciimonas TaxID=2644401 RepID=UPI002AB4D907|nr:MULTISPECIES: molybdopterin-binding protein [unclassified Glaciimonas]MDY7549051.1 molybdopterin-binding protein [Glaciimonas sp. CA11.2]MEB0013156.1 molybdopterin-binding protein [Glaciimonas sp. Cout2]MEB0081961.1 molybdopterin-binding protein [Glaciimonas sp. Gout2]MEB0163776.1 molybdopterin-binding protein [Glaciimonas sp. CA11.2]
MAIGLIIIGDEILSGKRIDKHFPKVLEMLTARGLTLSWAEYLGDDPARIIATLQRTFSSNDIVFCTGGIGATPDDHTRQCAAAALGVPLVLHPEAREKIRERVADTAREAGLEPDYETPDNLHRLKMGEFPLGADIIPNPYNKIPGFSFKNKGKAPGQAQGIHHFAPGFPVMAWPMFEWVLDTYHADLFHQNPQLEQSVFVYGAMESVLTPLMEAIEIEFPLVKVFSLPHVGDAETQRHIDLGVKGEPTQSAAAFIKMLAGLDQLHIAYRLIG